jgi:hypothetical protein
MHLNSIYIGGENILPDSGRLRSRLPGTFHSFPPEFLRVTVSVDRSIVGCKPRHSRSAQPFLRALLTWGVAKILPRGGLVRLVRLVRTFLRSEFRLDDKGGRLFPFEARITATFQGRNRWHFRTRIFGCCVVGFVPIRSQARRAEPPDVSPARKGWDTVTKHRRAPDVRHC